MASPNRRYPRRRPDTVVCALVHHDHLPSSPLDIERLSDRTAVSPSARYSSCAALLLIHVALGLGAFWRVPRRPVTDPRYAPNTQAARWPKIRGNLPRSGVAGGSECLLSAVISMGQRNTLTKTQNTTCMLMNLKETLSSHSSRESGAVGPLEASRGAEVARESD